MNKTLRPDFCTQGHHVEGKNINRKSGKSEVSDEQDTAQHTEEETTEDDTDDDAEEGSEEDDEDDDDEDEEEDEEDNDAHAQTLKEKAGVAKSHWLCRFCNREFASQQSYAGHGRHCTGAKQEVLLAVTDLLLCMILH